MRNKKIKKEISNTGLSIMIENLAGMVARGFDDVDKKFKDLDVFKLETEENFRKVDDKFKIIRGDILGLHDKFVSKFNFDKALTRIHKLERK